MTLSQIRPESVDEAWRNHLHHNGALSPEQETCFNAVRTLLDASVEASGSMMRILMASGGYDIHTIIRTTAQIAFQAGWFVRDDINPAEDEINTLERWLSLDENGYRENTVPKFLDSRKDRT